MGINTMLPAGPRTLGIVASAAPAAAAPAAARRGRHCRRGAGSPPALQSSARDAASTSEPPPGDSSGPSGAASSSTGRAAGLGHAWRRLPATARVALFTGAYISVAGIAALLFPLQLFALLFPAR